MRRDPSLYHLLVVEDNAGDRMLVEDFLAELVVSPKIDFADSFDEARDLLRNSSGFYHAILLDLTLPDMKGEQLLKEMLPLAKGIPIIILTGYTDESFAVKSLSMGASDYLLKDDLNATILYKSIIYNIERNKSLVNLRESEQRYSDLFHLSPQPMWVYDLETLQFLDVNDAALQHYGYSYEEFLSMNIRQIRPPEEQSRLDVILEKVRSKNRSTYHGESRHQKKNGEFIFVDIRSNLIRFKGRMAELVLVNDITERLSHIKAIERQNERLKEIAWTQSHMVRAPLARLMTIINLMETEKLSIEERGDYLGHIQSSAQELDEIIRQITDKTERIDLDQ